MLKLCVLTICALLLDIQHHVSATGNYVILAPQYLRAKHPYQLSIATNNFDEFNKLHLSIQGYTESDNFVDIVKNVQLKSSQTQLVEMDASTLPPGSYSLNILSGSGGKINRTIPLTVLDKAYTVLIQMDKPIYKPGNVVKFRVLVLDQTTKPVEKPRALRVTLSDPDENEIKVWPYAMLQNGIFQTQLEISNEPNLGNWSITANVHGLDHTVSFQVDDYNLPNYELRISSPKYATIVDREFIVDVAAWYIFGRAVKGNATVTINDSKALTKTARINGNMRLVFGMDQLRQQNYDEDGNIIVNVNVKIRDQYTRDNIESTSTLKIFNQSYQLGLKKSSKYFLPGRTYNCVIWIRNPLGEHLESIGHHQAVINVIYTGANKFHKSVDMRFTPESDGSIPLTLAVPSQATHAELDVSYQDSNEQFMLQSKHFNGFEHIQASVLNEQIAVNQPIIVQVESTVALNHLTYQVIAKGKILSIKHLRFEESASIQFEIDATPEMIPTSKIFVFSFFNGQLLKDTAPLFANSLTNWVNITAPIDKAQPGDRIQLDIETTPNSFIGLLAVDRRAWLMSEANQITKERVFEEIKRFSEGIETEDDEIMDMEMITNAANPTAVSARFGIYEPDEEDAYIRPRKEFPESWLWTDISQAGVDGKLHIRDTVPDSITSWKITAFSLSPEHGLGVLDEPVSLTVSKPFFIMINAPNSVKKSEVAIVKVTLFNELNDSSYVGVTLKNSHQEFEFVDNQGRKDASYQAKNVVIMANSASTVMFKIKPKKMGNILVKVIAESTEASDSVEQLLRVAPESLPYFKTERRFIQLQNDSQIYDLELKIPKHIDKQSEEILFSVQGNLLGDAVDGLEELIRMPSGSGEQNVLKMVPNILVLDYMISVGKINVFFINRAVKFLTMGYQNQLKFKHKDGSFSMLGKEDTRGSVFITALVAKTLQQASNFITMDVKLIQNAYNWLQLQQTMDGSFSESPNLPEYGLQRKHKDKDVLTAYTLIAFLEDERIAEKYKTVIEKGCQYLASRIQGMESRYALALTSYALKLANHEQEEYAFSKLLDVSISDDLYQLRWWDEEATATEATAYALLGYIKRGSLVDPLPILQWLISKRHLFGPENIETTFVGLQAVAEHSKRISPARNNYDVTLLSGSKQLATLIVDPETSLTVQNLSLPSDVRKVKVKVEGTGTGIFSFYYQYKTNILNLKPRFDVTVEMLSTSTSHYLDLQVCAKFKPSEAYEKSKLVLMEINFPSGYIALDESVEELERMNTVKKVTTKYDDASLWVYFESLPEKFLCLPVTGFRQSEVLQQIPGSVRVFDYFDNSRVAIIYFDGKQMDICDICDNQCPPECLK